MSDEEATPIRDHWVDELCDELLRAKAVDPTLFPSSVMFSDLGHPMIVTGEKDGDPAGCWCGHDLSTRQMFEDLVLAHLHRWWFRIRPVAAAVRVRRSRSASLKRNISGDLEATAEEDAVVELCCGTLPPEAVGRHPSSEAIAMIRACVGVAVRAKG